MVARNPYIHDSETECDRLERQATLHGPERIFSHIRLGPGARLLDAGSGSGWVARRIAARFPDAEVVGVDFKPEYVEYARRLARTEGLGNVSFQVADLQALPFEAGCFDAVWSQFVLYFLPDPGKAIAEFRRVTRPGGRVLAAVHERPMQLNFPEDPRLQPLIEKLVTNAMGGWESRKVPAMFSAAGLIEVDVEIELDRVYSKIGRMDPDRRANCAEVLRGGLRRFSGFFGGPAGAEAFLRDWLDYLGRDDTSSFTTYWVIKGRVPVAAARDGTA